MEGRSVGGDREGCNQIQDNQIQDDLGDDADLWNTDIDTNSNTPESTHARTR